MRLHKRDAFRVAMLLVFLPIIVTATGQVLWAIAPYHMETQTWSEQMRNGQTWSELRTFKVYELSIQYSLGCALTMAGYYGMVAEVFPVIAVSIVLAERDKSKGDR